MFFPSLEKFRFVENPKFFRNSVFPFERHLSKVADQSEIFPSLAKNVKSSSKKNLIKNRTNVVGRHLVIGQRLWSGWGRLLGWWIWRATGRNWRKYIFPLLTERGKFGVRQLELIKILWVAFPRYAVRIMRMSTQMRKNYFRERGVFWGSNFVIWLGYEPGKFLDGNHYFLPKRAVFIKWSEGIWLNSKKNLNAHLWI